MTFTIYLWPVVIGHGEDKQDVPHWFITVLKDEHMEGSEDIDFYSAQPVQGETLLLPMDNLQWTAERDGQGLDPGPTVRVNIVDSNAFDSPVRSHTQDGMSVSNPEV